MDFFRGGEIMPNIKSAKKRLLVTEINRKKNVAAKSQMKTKLKDFAEAVNSGNKEAAKTQLISSVSILDKTAAQGIIHKNAAARRKANLYKVYNQM